MLGLRGKIVLTAKKGSAPLATEFSGTSETAIWGYDDSVPGPTIRVRRGEEVRVRLINELDQPTSIHWHGIRIDNAMDGVPGLTQDAVPPGGTFDYTFTVPDSGSYWYHTHNRTWEQLARGMYGLLIVEDDDAQLFDLDIYLALDDWLLDQEGQIDENSFGDLHSWAHSGRLGNWLTVNGVSDPEVVVRAGERVRLRLVNAANARVFEFAFSGQEMLQIALDGHSISPIALPENRLLLSPGQRVDLMMDANGKPGNRIALQEVSYEQPLNAATIVYDDDPFVDGQVGKSFSGLSQTVNHDAFDLSDAARVDLLMEGGAMGSLNSAIVDGEKLEWQQLIERQRVWAFNGVAGDLDKPLLTAGRGQTVIVNMINQTRWEHAMHLHGHHFKVVSRNGVPTTNSPWRDTERVGVDQTVSIAFVADNPGKWLFHCHMVEHTAGGMMTRIDVDA